ncbi:MAG: hypothetical protein CL810_05370 [Cobetia sp.]|mgnify:FL=1|uniref:hypothetical protein n=1 Tax=Cobetia sp. TaxID=1873876 RepID=UPI000C5201C5|nr:hypothetical protein [Cobetia sp.]MBF09866.1 hypothetical protein [Cobetia sp.]MBK08982.1 hypothetical protein [Cobetia sp.]HBJ28120.1 hypothetical protein [Cobetia sp.]
MAFAVTRSFGAIPGLAAAALTLGLGLSLGLGLCLITPGASARAEAAQFRPTPKVINTLSSTYGFVIAQDITLSRIADEYPGLAPDAELASAYFKNAFPKITHRLAENLATLMGKDHAREVLEGIRRQIKKELDSQLTSDKLTSDFAARFIEAIHLRAQGEYLPSPFKEFLLATKYQIEPVYELYDGYFQEFHTKGHAKSLGINLALHLPASWSAADGRLPHIVQKWQSQAGTGTDMIILEIYDLHGDTVSDAQLKVMAATDQLAQWAPINSQMLDSGLTRVDNRQVYWFDIAMTQRHQGTPITSQTREYGLFLDDKLIRLHCTSYHPTADGTTYAKAKTDLTVDDGFSEIKPLCEGVMGSLVVMEGN